MKKSLLVNLLVGFAWLLAVTHTIAAEAASPSITAVLSPKRGDVWEPGKTYDIKWVYVGSVRAVSIRLVYQDDTRHAFEIAETENDGSFNFTVPSTRWIPAANDYRVEVFPLGGGGFAQSDLFGITLDGAPLITVLSPNGFETWVTNTTQEIRWASQLFGPSAAITINLVPFYATSASYLIAKDVPNTGSYSWNVGVVHGEALAIPAGTYTVTVCGADGVRVGCDSSDFRFFISNAPTTSNGLRLKNVRIWRPPGQRMVMRFAMEGAVIGQFYRLEQSLDMEQWKSNGHFLAMGYGPGLEEMIEIIGSEVTISEGQSFGFFRLVKD